MDANLTASSEKNRPPTLVSWYANHFDLVWRRAWKRGYTHQGLYYRSYSDLHDAWITRCLALAREHGTSFVLEQALSLREYLNRHPETRTTFRQLAKTGLFELLGGGEAVMDVNQCDGETMVRNMVSGLRFAHEVLGQKCVLACHNDGFGSSAQLPQVVRQCGLQGIMGLAYSTPDAPYWRGLDGSTVLAKFAPPEGMVEFYDHCYYEPCARCLGYGHMEGAVCLTCDGTGLRLSQGVYPPRKLPESINAPCGVYRVTSEEMMPDPRLPAELAARTAEGPISYRWGLPREFLPHWEAALARVDDRMVQVSSRVENNPTLTGTYVSRIRVKQAARQAEGWYFVAEAMAALTCGHESDVQSRLEALWLRLPLIFFHDAITGTHNDVACQELLDMAREVIDGAFEVAAQAGRIALPGARSVTHWSGAGCMAVFNPHGFSASLPVEIPAEDEGYHITDAAGRAVPVYREPAHQDLLPPPPAPVGPNYWTQRDEQPPRTVRFLAEDVPPFGWKTFSLAPREAALTIPLADTVEWAGYRVGWDTHGVRSIVVTATGQELMPAGANPAGHLLMERDIGDPWGTRDFDRRRTSCVPATRLLGAYQRGDAVEIVFAGTLDNGSFAREKDPSVFGCAWYQVIRLLKGLPWVEFDMDIFWQAVNQRIRVAFPSRAVTDRGIYKIPYGVLQRERYEMTEATLMSPNGDWPATYFAATMPHDDVPGIAVLNAGTPSARIEDGVLLYSVLRAPGFGHCLYRYAQEYPMPLSEMHDGGHHRFRFALMPFTGDNLAEVIAAGNRFNRPAPIMQVPTMTGEVTGGLAILDPGVFITAVKPAYNGGIAVRLVEQLGRAREATLLVPPGTESVWSANLLEEPNCNLAIHEGQVRVPLRPYEISTVLVRSNMNKA